jgi:hypothetical protein
MSDEFLFGAPVPVGTSAVPYGGSKSSLPSLLAEMIEERVRTVAEYDAELRRKYDALEARNLELMNEVTRLRGDVKTVEPLRPGLWYIGRMNADGSFDLVRPLVV